MTVTTEDNGTQNMWAKEPVMTYADHPWGVPHNELAEKLNGRWAMCGIVAGAISYALTGKLFFGLF
jgi:hypothetical protein